MSNGSTANTRQPDEEGALPSKTSIPFDFSGLTDRQVKYVTTRPERVLRPWLKNLPNGRSGWADMWCPLHEDPEISKASAGVNFKEHRWRCRADHCDSGGDLNFLLLEMAKLDGRVPDRRIEKLKRKKPEKLPSPALVHGWHEHLMTATKARVERAREYLRRVRFWDDDTLRELEVGYRSDRDLLTFPVYVNGELVNVRYRAVGPGYDMFGVTGGTTKRLYPHDVFMEDMRDPVVVCEGEMDLGMARSEGFNAVTTNTGASRAFVDVIQEHAEAFRGRAVMVTLDAGAEEVSQAAVDVLETAGAHATGLQWPDKPDGYDLTDARKELGDKFAPHLRKLLAGSSERPIVVTGGEFILDEPEGVPSVWGDDGNRVLWAEGEGFMLVGPQGVGKTTLAQQIALRKIGLGAELLLDIPIKPAEGKILYLAMDRPRQAARSFRRMVRKEDRETLDERLVIHRGPLSFDPTADEEGLWELMKEHGCVYVIVDSLKDYASSLTDDGIAIKSNRSFQWVISHGGEVLILHHQRKANNDNRKPDKLDDVYGSTWHTSGMGSVVLLWGKPGSHEVELRHLKQPAEPVGPLHLSHDHATGTIALSTAAEDEEVALLDAVQAANPDGLDLTALTESLGRDANERRDREATRRRLAALERREDLRRVPGKRGGKGGSEPARWELP